MAYRYTNRERVLWADAVCINQMAAAENAQQVSMVSNISSKAKTIQIWLAPHYQYKHGSSVLEAILVAS
jgi:hypothetical protein